MTSLPLVRPGDSHGDTDGHEEMDNEDEERFKAQKFEEKIVAEKIYLPQWFDPTSYKYNREFLLAAVPGIFILWYMTGNGCFYISTGFFIAVYLSDYIGEKDMALVLSFLGVISSQVYLLYRIVTIVWDGHWLLLITANIFHLMVGCWVLLQSEWFRFEEPGLTPIFEKLLFTVCPVAVSHMISSFLSDLFGAPTLQPYWLCLSIYFYLYHIMTPKYSSFYKKEFFGSEEALVVNPENMLQMLMVFFVFPVVMLVFQTLIYRQYMSFLIQCCLLVSLETFLTTVANTMWFFDYLGITDSTLWKARFVSGVSAVCMLLLLSYEVTTAMVVMVWLTPVITQSLLHIVNEEFPEQDLIKLFTLAASCCTSVLNISLLGGHNVAAYPLIVCCSAGQGLLCLVAALPVRWRIGNWRDVFVAMECVLCVAMEMIVYWGLIYSPVMTLIPAVIQSFTVYGLCRDTTSYSALLTMAVHCVKLPFLLSSCGDSSAGGHIELDLDTAFTSVCVLVVAGTVLKLLLFLRGHIQPHQVLRWFVGLGVVSFMLRSCLISPIYRCCFGSDPEPYQTIACALAVWFLLSLKLLHYHVKESDIQTNVWRVTWILLPLCVVVYLMKPVLTPTSLFDLLPYCMLLSVVVTMATALKLVPVSSNKLLMIVRACVMMAPVSVLYCTLLYDSVDVAISGLYVVCGTLGGLLLLFIYDAAILKSTHKVPVDIMNIFHVWCGMAGVCWLVEFVHYGSDDDDIGDHSRVFPAIWRPSLLFNAVLLLVIATCLKGIGFVSKYRRPFSPIPYEVPILLNRSAVLAYAMAVLSCPITYWEYWICGCSAILALIHRKVRYVRQKSIYVQLLPCFALTDASLMVVALVSCKIWKARKSMDILTGIFEIFFLLLTLPNHISALSLLQYGRSVVPVVVDVMLLPCNWILFILAHSWLTFLYAVLGSAVAFWHLSPVLVEFLDN